MRALKPLRPREGEEGRTSARIVLFYLICQLAPGEKSGWGQVADETEDHSPHSHVFFLAVDPAGNCQEGEIALCGE